MPNLSERQREQQRQNCHKYYRNKTSRERLHNIIKDNFQSATLLTLYWSPAAPMPASFVSKYLMSWNRSVKWRVDRKYEYVRVTEYTDFKAGTMVFRYITNLTEAQCEKIAADWCMGKTEIDPLSPDDLDNLSQALLVCSEPLQRLEKHQQWFSHSRGVRPRLICGTLQNTVTPAPSGDLREAMAAGAVLQFQDGSAPAVSFLPTL